MKRFAIALCIIILLVMLSPCFSIIAQPTHIPHQKPAAAKRSPQPASLLLFYSDVFELAATNQYQDAESLLHELEYANIPKEVRYLVDRYSALSRQLFTTLDNLEAILDEASTLLGEYKTGKAKQRLEAATVVIDDARLVLNDIETATNTLGDSLGVLATPAASQIRLAYDRLKQALLRLRQCIDEFNRLEERLTQRREIQAVELIPTRLSLSITRASVFVGDSISARGRLTGYGNPLAKREVTLLLNDEPLVINTTRNGRYATDITIPYRYASTMTLRVIYTPSGDDIGTYQASASRPVVVNTIFYPTVLEVSAPEIASPGLPITVSGQVSSTGGDIDRTIRVLLDNTQLAQEVTRGQFSLQVTLPQHISTGKHSLTVVATPQGHYSGASRTLTLNISTLPIQTDIQLPLLIAIPRPIQISGKVYHSLGPIGDARVSFAFRDCSTIVETTTDGNFTATMDTPHDLFLMGPQELGITIEPVEPWYTSLHIKRWIFAISPANIGLMLVVFVSLGLLIYNRVRPRAVGPREELVIPKAERKEPFPTAPPGPKYEFTGAKGRVLAAYLDGLGAVQKVTSIPMAPYTTLREFLNAATPQLARAAKPFTKLTTIAERALYSAHRLDEDTATEAEQLAVNVREELHSGAA